jgi:trk system potassium uptake protein TrkA
VDGELLEFEVKPNSKILDVEIKDLDFPRSAIIGGVIRNNQGITVRGNFTFQEKDRVVVLSKPECIRTVEGFFK